MPGALLGPICGANIYCLIGAVAQSSIWLVVYFRGEGRSHPVFSWSGLIDQPSWGQMIADAWLGMTWAPDVGGDSLAPLAPWPDWCLRCNSCVRVLRTASKPPGKRGLVFVESHAVEDKG